MSQDHKKYELFTTLTGLNPLTSYDDLRTFNNIQCGIEQPTNGYYDMKCMLKNDNKSTNYYGSNYSSFENYNDISKYDPGKLLVRRSKWSTTAPLPLNYSF